MWVKRAQRSKPEIGKLCFFDSYQNIYCVAVNFRGKPFTQFSTKFHFHMPSSTSLLTLENSSITTRGLSTNLITSEMESLCNNQQLRAVNYCQKDLQLRCEKILGCDSDHPLSCPPIY